MRLQDGLSRLEPGRAPRVSGRGLCRSCRGRRLCLCTISAVVVSLSSSALITPFLDYSRIRPHSVPICFLLHILHRPLGDPNTQGYTPRGTHSEHRAHVPRLGTGVSSSPSLPSFLLTSMGSFSANRVYLRLRLPPIAHIPAPSVSTVNDLGLNFPFGKG